MTDPAEWLETVGKRKLLRLYIAFKRWCVRPGRYDNPIYPGLFNAKPTAVVNIYTGWMDRLDPKRGWTQEMYK